MPAPVAQHQMAAEHPSVQTRVIHPLVYTQAETGRKVLNISPWHAVAIEGMENEEGDAILREVVAYAIRPDLAYIHKWEKNDMVLWDNLADAPQRAGRSAGRAAPDAQNHDSRRLCSGPARESGLRAGAVQARERRGPESRGTTLDPRLCPPAAAYLSLENSVLRRISENSSSMRNPFAFRCCMFTR